MTFFLLDNPILAAIFYTIAMHLVPIPHMYEVLVPVRLMCVELLPIFLMCEKLVPILQI